jgi:hypothetical protein
MNTYTETDLVKSDAIVKLMAMFTKDEQRRLQLVSKEFYDRIVPLAMENGPRCLNRVVPMVYDGIM